MEDPPSTSSSESVQGTPSPGEHDFALGTTSPHQLAQEPPSDLQEVHSLILVVWCCSNTSGIFFLIE